MKEKLQYKRKISKGTIFIFAILIILALALLYFIFFHETNISGNVVKNSYSLNGTPISASLSIPNITLKGIFNEIDIKLKRNPGLYIIFGDQKIELDNLNENQIMLSNFDGKIYLQKEGVSNIEGGVEKIFVNGVPITPKSKRSGSISFSKDLVCEHFLTKERVLIKELDYQTTGEVVLNNGRFEISLRNENIRIKNLVTKLNIEENRFKVEGEFESIGFGGDSEISVDD